MTAPDRIETSRTPCECGKGEFVFYQCEPDGWSFLNHPEERWHELHIFCDNCVKLFKNYEPHRFSRTGEPDRWITRITEPDRVPEH